MESSTGTPASNQHRPDVADIVSIGELDIRDNGDSRSINLAGWHFRHANGFEIIFATSSCGYNIMISGGLESPLTIAGYTLEDLARFKLEDQIRTDLEDQIMATFCIATCSGYTPICPQWHDPLAAFEEFSAAQDEGERFISPRGDDDQLIRNYRRDVSGYRDSVAKPLPRYGWVK